MRAGRCFGGDRASVFAVRILFHSDRRSARHCRFGCRLLVSQYSADRAVRSGRARCLRAGLSTFVESSPHPALIAGIEDTFNDCVEGNAEAVVVPDVGPRQRRA